MKERTLITLARVLICASLLSPLFVMPATFIFPFVVPKILFFRSVVALLFGVYLLLLFHNPEGYRPKKTLIQGSVFLFFISMAVSTFAGVDWYRSFWDNHERMLGLFTMAHYVLFFSLLTLLLPDWNAWRPALRFFLGVGITIALIAAWQVYGDPDFLLNRGKDRVSSTLGNPIYLSGFGLFTLAIGLLLSVKEKETRWRHFGALGAFFGFMSIFWGGTRGTFLGLIAAVVIALVVSFFVYRKEPRIRHWITIALLSCGVLFSALFFFRDASLVQGINPLRRLFAINYSSLATDTRVMAWSIALDASKEYPIFGWGPNNYFYAFNKYYRPEFLEHGYAETWFDNAHSALLNTLAIQGLVGLAAYSALFLCPCIVLVRSYRKGSIDPPLLIIGIAFLAGHFVHNITVFENPTSYLYFFFFLACMAALTNQEGKEVSPSPRGVLKQKQVSSVQAGIVFVAVLLFVYTTNINPARANSTMLQTLYVLSHDMEEGMHLYSNAQAIPTPHVDDIRADYVRNIISVLDASSASLAQDTRQRLVESAAKELEKNASLHPNDIRTHLLFFSVAEASARHGGSTILLPRAEQLLREALVLSPKRQQLFFTLSAFLEQTGRGDEAKKFLEEVQKISPGVGEVWWRLALFYARQGDTARANEVLTQAQEEGIVFTKEEGAFITQSLKTYAARTTIQ